MTTILIHRLRIIILLLAASTLFSSYRFMDFIRGKEEPRTAAGWPYNDPQMGAYVMADFEEQRTPHGMVYIPGGTFVMGRTQEDVMRYQNNIPRRVTVSSFYMDETEVTNRHYVDYLQWTARVYAETYPEVYIRALPDTLVWLDPLAYNEPFVENYLRHPAYREYPVVGVSWVQANDFAKWRTDRANELILIQKGILEWDPNARNENVFNTEAYLAGQYEGLVREGVRDLDPLGTGRSRVRREDGILWPSFRLPTEAEWEYAALGLIGNTIDGNVVEMRMYPWDGTGVRADLRRNPNQLMANVRRGRGDLMGIAGDTNPQGDITMPVYSFWPNDFGLYNMAGNVNEWVGDVYRPLSHETVSDFNPFRGNVFRALATDEAGRPLPKDSLGRLRFVDLDNTISYRDGDAQSSLFPPGEDGETPPMYLTGETTLVGDEVRVYKGGSWRDRIYWTNPGNRRFLNQNAATNDIGFRCAMTRVGGPPAHGN